MQDLSDTRSSTGQGIGGINLGNAGDYEQVNYKSSPYENVWSKSRIPKYDRPTSRLEETSMEEN